ncbi:MAG: hypothetical protein ACW99F_07765 [Candidatus Hodarchaeales archaeon]|jgi:tRNA (pseudouridine54-N1)-methyltransferase
MTRTFIIISNTVDISKPFSLNSLTAFGRIDVLCRCISTSFYLSNGFRKDVILLIYFSQNQKLLTIDGSIVKGINPDERAIAGILKKVFRGAFYIGITISGKNLTEILKEHQPLMLDMQGEEIDNFTLNSQSFIIGDHQGYPDDYESDFETLTKVSLGLNEYLSSQVLSILNYKIDREIS